MFKNPLIFVNLLWSLSFRNIEDIMAEKGDKVQRISGSEVEFVPSENSLGKLHQTLSDYLILSIHSPKPLC